MTIARLLPRFREARAAIDGFAARERWSRGDIEAYQLSRLNETWGRAVAHVPYCRDLARTHRLPDQFASLDEFTARVPTLGKPLVRDHRERLLSDAPAPGRWCATTGSTGVRTRVFREHRAHLTSLRARYRFLDAWGIDIFDRSVMLWGDRIPLMPLVQRPLARASRFAEDSLRHRLRLPADRVDSRTLRGYLRRMARFRPAVLYAYSSSAYLLAREAIRSGLRCESLRLVILTSELAAPHMIETVQRAFGAPAVLEYGSVECGFLAGGYPNRRLVVREDAALVETLPREDGRYDIAVTVLGNPSFPLLRYLVGDTTDSPLVRPASGLATLSGISGRESDALTTRTGSLVHAAAVYHVLERDAAVRRFLARQQPDGSVDVLVEAEAIGRAPDVVGITRHLERLVGFPVLLKLVSALPASAGSKHVAVVSSRVPSTAGRT